MTFKDAFDYNMNMAELVVDEYLKDLSDADLLLRPAPKANHIAWQLGHLIVSHQGMLSKIGAAPAALPAGFDQRHDNASSQAANGQFDSKETYLRLLKELNAEARRFAAAAPAADLARPAPESMQAYAPKVGDVLQLLASHIMMHVGQFAVVRRILDKPVVL